MDRSLFSSIHWGKAVFLYLVENAVFRRVVLLKRSFRGVFHDLAVSLVVRAERLPAAESGR